MTEEFNIKDIAIPILIIAILILIAYLILLKQQLYSTQTSLLLKEGIVI